MVEDEVPGIFYTQPMAEFFFFRELPEHVQAAFWDLQRAFEESELPTTEEKNDDQAQ